MRARHDEYRRSPRPKGPLSLDRACRRCAGRAGIRGRIRTGCAAILRDAVLPGGVTVVDELADAAEPTSDEKWATVRGRILNAFYFLADW